MRYGPCQCQRAIRGGPALRTEMCKRLATQADRLCDTCRAGCEELELDSALGPLYLNHVGWPNDPDPQETRP